MSCQSCKCQTTPCGCEDQGLTTPPTCGQNTPQCPNPNPCAEIFDSNCIIYNGPDIKCGQETIIPKGISVQAAFINLVNFLKDNNVLNCNP